MINRHVFAACFLIWITSTARADAPAVKFEISVDTSAVPQMADYGERTRKLLVEWYPRLIAELPSDGFKPTDKIEVIFQPRKGGVAETSGGHIVATAKWFQDRPDDIGAFVHELTHVVQAYHKGDRPGWLVEGIADYIRWYEYEPVNKRPHPNPKSAKYTDSYQTTAHFLNYVRETYDKDLVAQLNAACRAATYHEALWKELTGKTLQQLGEEWKQSLNSKP